MQLSKLKEAIAWYVNDELASFEVLEALADLSKSEADDIVFFLAEFVISPEAKALEERIDRQRLSRRGREAKRS